MSLYDLTEFTWESTSESSSGVYRAVVGNNGGREADNGSGVYRAVTTYMYMYIGLLVQ